MLRPAIKTGLRVVSWFRPALKANFAKPGPSKLSVREKCEIPDNILKEMKQPFANFLKANKYIIYQ